MNDISEHWAEEYIKDLTYMGVFKGSDKNANPDDYISRAEFIALIIRALDLEEAEEDNNNSFTDINKKDWFYKDISIAKHNKIITGQGDGNFLPHNKITREEIMLIIARTLNTDDQKSTIDNKFIDIKTSYKYNKELNIAIGSGIITGYDDKTFKAKNNALRSEAAVMISRLLYCTNRFSQPIDKEKAEEEILKLINQYIESYTYQKNNQDSNLEYNINNSIGKENNDIFIKSDIIELYKQKNINLIETIEDIEFKDLYIKGNIAKITAISKAVYNRQFSDNTTRIKTYKKEQNYSLINKQGKWYIYNKQERLYKDEKINLTWEQTYVKNDAEPTIPHMEGLNVISPTWFKAKEYYNDTQGIKHKFENLYEGLQSDIRMEDIGSLSFIEWAHKNNYDVWPLFNNEFDIDVADKILNNNKSRKKTIELLLEYTDKYKLDGINLDFENMYYKDRHRYTDLLRELAPLLREQGVITSVDVTKIEASSINWSMCYDRKGLDEVVDYVALMAYDQNGTWSTVSGSVAQYNWVENSIKGLLTQVRNEKLLLGVPFYVRVWEEKDGKVINTIATSMEKVQNLINENKAKIVWDETSGQYIARYEKDSKTIKIWVEDKNSINLKLSLIHKYKLGGIASWSRGFETPDIWDTINKNLKLSTYEEWLSNN